MMNTYTIKYHVQDTLESLRHFEVQCEGLMNAIQMYDFYQQRYGYAQLFEGDTYIPMDEVYRILNGEQRLSSNG